MSVVAEQSALRRVAELVARQAPPEQVFALVMEELNRLMDVTNVATARFEPDGTATVMAVRGTAQDRFPPGANVQLTGGSMIERVFRTGRPAHVEDYKNVGGQLGPVMRELGAGWAAAGPIVVDGQLWGAMVVNSSSAGTYLPGAEERVAQFAELVSTAISNIESRAKVERLAAEQSALRRVATLVAREHSPEDLFATLAEEVRVLLGVDASEILRYEADATATMIAVASRRPEPLPPDTEARLAEFSRVAGMAVANAKSRSDLAQSRARIVRAGSTESRPSAARSGSKVLRTPAQSSTSSCRRPRRAEGHLTGARRTA